MSLLIKALEKAEEGKKSEVKKPSAAADELTLETVSVSFDVEGDEFSLEEPAASVGAQQRQAAAMRNIQRTAPGVSKGTWLLTGAGALAAILLGVGLYLYLQSLSQPELIVAHTEPPAQNKETPVQADIVQPGASSMISTAQESVTPSNEPQKPENISAQSSSAAIFKEARQPDEKVAAVTGKPVSAEKTQVFGEAIESSPDTTVKITKNKPANGVNPNLAIAYQALVSGDDAYAERNYRAVLQGDTRNVDALLGLATLAVRQGKTLEAQSWYGKVLEIEPRNSTAQTALIEIGNQADPVTSETRLKTLLAQHPDAAYLYAALGDLYSGQNMWPAAQQAYFQAHHYQPDEPHYAFNLAISLDQMAKPALALQYYQQTLTLLDKVRVSDIDRAQVEARIAQLQQ